MISSVTETYPSSASGAACAGSVTTLSSLAVTEAEHSACRLTRCCGRQIFEWVKAHGGEPIIPFSGTFENKLFDMPADEKEAYCKEVHIEVCSHALSVRWWSANTVYVLLGWIAAEMENSIAC